MTPRAIRASALFAGLALLLATPAAAAAAPSYLVIPPGNRADGGAEFRSTPWIGEAIAEAISSGLAGAGAEVASREERRGIERELGISPTAVTTLATRLKEAEELEVERVVLGDYSISGESVGVTMRVYDHAAGSRGPVLRVDPVPLAQLARLQAEVSKRILSAEGFRPDGSLPSAFVAPASEALQPAYESRLRALIDEDPLRKAAMLERAVAEDPDYLRARFELAIAWREAGSPEKALAALSARPLLAGPGTAGRADLVADSEALLASLSSDAGLKDASVDAWRRSLRARDDAAVRIQLARTLLARGDRAVAAAELELARRLDPANPELAEAQELVEAAAPAP